MVDTIRAMANESITQIGKGKKKLGRKTFNRVDFGHRRIKLRLQRHPSCVKKSVLNLHRYPKTDPQGGSFLHTRIGIAYHTPG